MSKRTSSGLPRLPQDKATVAYWQRRLFRNSYTRAGALHRVQGWYVKIQQAGTRQTFPLSAPGRAAAAREALALFRKLLAGTPNAEKSRLDPRRDSFRRAGGSAPLGRARVRLVQRPHAPTPDAAPELSAHLECDGHNCYFPLGTLDPVEAARRARCVQSELSRDGLAAVQTRHPREATVALQWSANPVAWTYFTVHTCGGGKLPPDVEISGAARSGKLAVAVLEPDPGLRRALLDSLGRQGNCRAVAGWARAADALSELARRPVGLLLVNHTLDGLSGADFLGRLRHLSPRLPGLIYSVYDDSDQLFKSTPGGAIGYLLRRTSPHRILEPLATSLPEQLDAPEISARVRHYFHQLMGSTVSSGSLEMARLTPRELEILGLLGKGYLDKEIAQVLRISIWTVHGHAKKIYEKLGVHSRTEAVVKYLQK